MDWIVIPLQQSPSTTFVSLDDLFVLLLVPLLGGGLVLTVLEDILGYRESISFGVVGGLLLGLAVLVGPQFDYAVARTLRRAFGWRIGFQVGRPLTLYWGIWGALLLAAAYDESTGDGESSNIQ